MEFKVENIIIDEIYHGVKYFIDNIEVCEKLYKIALNVSLNYISIFTE